MDNPCECTCLTTSLSLPAYSTFCLILITARQQSWLEKLWIDQSLKLSAVTDTSTSIDLSNPAIKLESMTSRSAKTKMPKATSSSTIPGRRHNPLETDIVGGSGILRSAGKKSQSKPDRAKAEYVEAKQSATILQLGRQLADEDELANAATTEQKSAFDVDSRFAPGDDEQDDGAYEDDASWADEEEEIEVDEAEIAPEDLAMFNKFLSADEEDPLLKHGWDLKAGAGEEQQQQQGSTNLADLIMDKIQAFESGGGGREEMGGMDDYPEEDLPPKVVEVYTKYVTHIRPHIRQSTSTDPFAGVE